MFSLMFDDEEYGNQQDRTQPGLLQGGSLALPVPGGLDYSDPEGLTPTYLGPGGQLGTAPYVPYTPPQVGQVGYTSFDELDHSMYDGLLDRTHPERLEDPYAGWGEPNRPAEPGNPLAPPSSGGGLLPEATGDTSAGGAGVTLGQWGDDDLAALLMDLKRNPANQASGLVQDYARTHNLGDWKGLRDAAYGYVNQHGSALGDLFVEDGMWGGNG